MKSWSVRREPNSALSWQAYDEARLSHWHMSLLEELMPAKGGHLAEVQCLLPLASQREEKRGQERTSGRQRQKSELQTSQSGVVFSKTLLEELLLARM